jgi:putative oxidoreductase
VAIGFFTPIASALLCITMFVATIMHVSKGDSFQVYSHAFESCILFFSLIFIGSGKYALKCKT